MEDYYRIKNIIDLTKNNLDAQKKMAQNVANKSPNWQKNLNRAKIAMEYFLNPDVAKIFLDRALVLNTSETTKTQIYQDLNYKIGKLEQEIKNKTNYENHINNSDLNKDGLFYNIGIPVLHKQIEGNKNIAIFRSALTRITQELVGQKHIFIMPNKYNEKEGELFVQCSPNFTYPKDELRKAVKQYPKLLAEYLNKIYGFGTVKVDNRNIIFMKDIDFKKFIISVYKTDVIHGLIPNIKNENKIMKIKLSQIKNLIKEELKFIDWNKIKDNYSDRYATIETYQVLSYANPSFLTHICSFFSENSANKVVEILSKIPNTEGRKFKVEKRIDSVQIQFIEAAEKKGIKIKIIQN